jgi:hypothetical protein
MVTGKGRVRLPSTAGFCTLTRPYPVTLLPNGSGYLRANTFLVFKPAFLQPNSFHAHLPAYEDGTYTVLRNVGIQNSDAGELHRRKHTKLRTGRKFEIKNNLVLEQSVPKRRHTNFRRRGITQKKTYNT